jgi:hypothetical protein
MVLVSSLYNYVNKPLYILLREDCLPNLAWHPFDVEGDIDFSRLLIVVHKLSPIVEDVGRFDVVAGGKRALGIDIHSFLLHCVLVTV